MRRVQRHSERCGFLVEVDWDQSSRTAVRARISNAVAVLSDPELKISDFIVLTVTVFVMNRFPPMKWSAEITSHHQTMLSDIAVVQPHRRHRVVMCDALENITIVVGPNPATPHPVATASRVPHINRDACSLEQSRHIVLGKTEFFCNRCLRVAGTPKPDHRRQSALGHLFPFRPRCAPLYSSLDQDTTNRVDRDLVFLSEITKRRAAPVFSTHNLSIRRRKPLARPWARG